MCVVFLTSNQAEHIKVLTTALYAPLRLTERERKAERETVSSTAHSVGQCVWIPHSGSYLTQYDLTPSYTHTHLNKWANVKEWDTVRKGNKTFYPQCWTSNNAVLSFISSPVLSVLFHLIGFFLLRLAERHTQYHLFLKGKWIKIDHGVTAHSNSSEWVTLVWMHCHLLDEWHITGENCIPGWTFLDNIWALSSGHRSFWV